MKVESGKWNNSLTEARKSPQSGGADKADGGKVKNGVTHNNVWHRHLLFIALASLSTFNFRFALLLRASAIKILLIALCLSSVQLSIAQKFPERHVTRQGTRLYNKGDYTGAETEYRRALELNPELREAAFNLGNALWRQAQTSAQPDQDERQQKAIQDKAV